MDDRDDVKRSAWCFHPEAIDDRDTNGTKFSSISKAKADVKCPITDDCPECPK
jgi:hypothetical protein